SPPGVPTHTRGGAARRVPRVAAYRPSSTRSSPASGTRRPSGSRTRRAELTRPSSPGTGDTGTVRPQPYARPHVAGPPILVATDRREPGPGGCPPRGGTARPAAPGRVRRRRGALAAARPE